MNEGLVHPYEFAACVVDVCVAGARDNYRILLMIAFRTVGGA